MLAFWTSCAIEGEHHTGHRMNQHSPAGSFKPLIATIATMVLCAPTVLGVVALTIVEIFRGRQLPLATPADRLFVFLMQIGGILAIFGVPFLVCGALVGVWSAWTLPLSSTLRRVVQVTLGCALVAAVYMSLMYLEVRRRFPNGPPGLTDANVVSERASLADSRCSPTSGGCSLRIRSGGGAARG